MTRPVISRSLAALQPPEVRAMLAKNPAAVQRGHTARGRLIAGLGNALTLNDTLELIDQ